MQIVRRNTVSIMVSIAEVITWISSMSVNMASNGCVHGTPTAAEGCWQMAGHLGETTQCTAIILSSMSPEATRHLLVCVKLLMTRKSPGYCLCSFVVSLLGRRTHFGMEA